MVAEIRLKKAGLNSFAIRFPGVNVLFISLITCPKGINNLATLESKYSNLTVRHIIKLTDGLFIGEAAVIGEDVLFTDIREIVTRLYPITTNGQPIGPKPYHPLGYKKTGALVVLCSNTPDNTLPVIHLGVTKMVLIIQRITRV